MSEGRQGVLARFGNVHRTIHGDPDAVIRRILDTSEAMLWDRGRIYPKQSLTLCGQGGTERVIIAGAIVFQPVGNGGS